MIKISIDEGAAFDMLSIAALKSILHPENDANENGGRRIVDEIEQCIGKELTRNIILSEEYKELADINTRIYLAIDNLKSNEVLGDACKIDRLNHARFAAKKKIQEKFFGNNLTEQKFGYNNE